MKWKSLRLFVLVSLGALVSAQAQTQYILKVKGLTCPFCAYGLEKKLKKVPGVASVAINLEEDEAIVVVKDGDTVEEEALRNAVNQAGFQLASMEKSEGEEGNPPRGSKNASDSQGVSR